MSSVVGSSPSTLILVSGVAQGGSVELRVNGVLLELTTSLGTSDAEVAQAISQLVAQDPTLQADGVSATSMGATVSIMGGEATDPLVSDPGLLIELVPGGSLEVPAAETLARVMLALGLLTAGLLNRKTRSHSRKRPIGHAPGL